MHFQITTKNVPTIGDTLREFRAEAQITQEVVARRMGCLQSFVSQVESNTLIPTLPTILKYLKAINCKITIESFL